MWSSFWKEVTAPLPSPQHGATGDDASNNRSIGVRKKDAAAAAGRCRHVDARGSEPAADYTTILRGVIVGEEQSGKTSLIRRLRGEDPFQKDSLDDERATKNTNRRSNGNLMALIPWKTPQAALFRQNTSHVGSIDVVQLYVSEGTGFCSSRKDATFQEQWISVLQSQRGKEIDFIVWMIDPRMDEVLDFFKEGLDALIYSRVRETDGQGHKESHEIIMHTLVQNICILVNFRDTGQYNGNLASLVGQIQLVIEQVLSSHRKFCEKHRQSCTDNMSTPTILVYESSMKDCYGLSNLLSFINLPYLSRKEREFRRLAERAQRQHSQWKREMMTTKAIEYDEFIKQRLAQQIQTPILSTERQRLEEEKEQLRHQLRQQRKLMQSDNLNQIMARAPVIIQQRDENGASPAIKSSPADRSDAKGKHFVAQAKLNDDAEKRTIFAKSLLPSAERKDLMNSGAPKDVCLDSFFSDDEEGEQSDSNDSSDDSEGEESDDGDFYIDVSGTRCANANSTAKKHAKKSLSNRLDTDNKKQGVTAEERSNHTDEKYESTVYASDEESVDVAHSAVKSPYVTKIEVVKVSGEKTALSNNSVSGASNVEEVEAAECAHGSMNDETSKSNTCSRTINVSSEGKPSFDEQNTNCTHDGLSIDETTPTNSQRADENTIKTSAQIVVSESIDEPMDSGAVAITVNEWSRSTDEDSDNDSSFQIACIRSNRDYPEEYRDRVNRKDRHDREDIETHIENVQIDDSEDQQLPTKEKSHLVLDSDEEGSTEGTVTCDTKCKREIDSAGCDAEFTRDASQPRPTTSTVMNRMNAPAKSVTVSSAARAAIEAAKVEAERMIELSQSNDVPIKKREKKSKKSKDGKKKKKKEKKHDD